MNNIHIQRLKGQQAHSYIQELGHLRMTVFREYPYLYEGELKYETDYLNTYLQCEEAVLVIAKDGTQIVGASTAIPLDFEVDECQKPFIDNRLAMANIFYFGESLLLPAYRGKGVYRQFFEQREAAAKEYGSQFAAFCSVVREKNDPRRPLGYTPLDDIWQRFGYQEHPELVAYYKWQEIDHAEQTIKPMVFWMKKL